jgi:hypothetical protein
MTALVLAVKAGLAVLLLAAGGAKLADLDGFGTAIGIFLPGHVPAGIAGRVKTAAAAVAVTEVAAGAISLGWPAARWANVLVLVLACGFTVVAAVGYGRHRGRPCRCFGALTRRGFSRRTLLQAVLITVAAVVAASGVHSAAVSLGLAAHLLLLAAAGLMALAAATAARAMMADAAAGLVA